MNDWSEDVTLVDSVIVPDEYGNQVPTETHRVVQASKREIAMNEFYTAAQAGIRPAVELIIHTFEYEGEQVMIYKGQRYSLIRTYQRNDDELEIYLEQKVSDDGN
ncbi:phage head closure protein [Lacticaseibacillus brantae]|uniref:Phage head-tail adaptor n=1 Tax=Lacticaseibacillus brantae DSM 23927 TaxID=1423727 RepID=A0A0R2B2N4_9LACO|nr:phage head closure protein [Lacticaseibacillus brantae]KRM73010.1 hypothetical protein FC34_GL000730 [Lacticaseibacillus brantae DSM 23927]